jgi:hypothetical protein
MQKDEVTGKINKEIRMFVFPEQHRAIKKEARKQGMLISTWVRISCMKELQRARLERAQLAKLERRMPKQVA